MTEEPLQEGPEEDVEQVDGVLVPASVRTVDRQWPGGQVAVQAAAVAATGFVAGAATVAVVRHHRVKKTAKRQRRTAQRQLANVLASRSFLVDVHLLGGRD